MDFVDGYACRCPEQFSGRHCQLKRGSRCASMSPCLNDALCVDVLPDDFLCHCPPGFSGSLCQVVDHVDICYGAPCAAGSTCRATHDDRGFECLCSPGRQGPRCEHLRPVGSAVNATVEIIVDASALTVPQLVRLYCLTFILTNNKRSEQVTGMSMGSTQGRRHGFESGGGQFCERSEQKNFFDPPLFGQWGGDKILLR